MRKSKMLVHATALTGAGGKGWSRLGVGGQQCGEPGGAGPTGGRGGGQSLAGEGSVVRTSSPPVWVGTDVVSDYRDIGAFWVLL